MQPLPTKVLPPPTASQVRPALRPWLALLLPLLLLGSSCARKLNQYNGRYYSARDMARLKRERGRGAAPAPARPGSRPVVVKQKVKARPGAAGPAGTGAESGAVVVAPAKVVRKYTVRPSSAQGVVALAIQAARSYQGTPYLYGGTTRAGLDCSALLQNAFAEAGVDIPRSSNEQAAWGEPISPTELRPGDFLFFGPVPGSPTITHVGLVTVVDGEGVEFIHASTSLGVIENGFETDYYLSRFIRAVRPRL